MSRQDARSDAPASDWRETWEHFHRLLELDPQERRSYLDRIALDDPVIGRELASLLAAHAASHPLLDRAGPVRLDLPDACVDVASDELGSSPEPGQRLGPYRLIRPLGEGGMGIVYLAERVDPEVPQRVAIKLLSGSGDVPMLVERFRRERSILAHLDHASIARLIDVGDAPDGRPYVVMEYVDGKPIDVHCDDAGLGLRERLELVIAVCAAVDVAHRSLVVHRDLKPSNVLVTNEGVPKLVDFGIARRLDDGEATLGGSRVLTPRWASPEQLRDEPVTTATDIYTLGLLLCQLLIGRLPYRAPTGDLLMLAREILDHEPQRPSALAANPGVGYLSPAELARRLRGDLDAIVLRALAKAPDSRYRSAAELAADLQRYLDGYPVQARAPGLVATVRKLVARHPLGSGAVAAFAVTAVAFVAITATLNVRLTRSLERLEAEQANAARQRELALQTASFLESLFRSISPEATRGQEPTLRQVLDVGAARLLDDDTAPSDPSLELDPRTRVELLLTLAAVYSSLSDFDRASTLAQHAEDTSRRLEDPILLAESLSARARVEHAAGDYSRAAELVESALALYERDPRADAERKASLLSDLGVARIGLEQGDAAEHALRRALELIGAERSELGAVVRLRLGSLERRRGELAAARELLEVAVRDLGDILGADHPESLLARKELADTLRALGEHQRALRVLEAALRDAERVYGTEHAELAPLLDRISLVHQTLGELTAAEQMQRRALAIRELHFGPSSVRTTISVNNLGWLLHDFGRYEEAAALYRRALKSGESTLGPEHPSVAISLNNLGLLALDRGRPQAAVPYLERAVATLTDRLGAEHPNRAFPLTNLGNALHELGRTDAAERLLREALELRRARLPTGHEDLGPTLSALGRLLCETDRVAEGEALVRQALAIERADRPAESFGAALVELELGCCLLRRGELEQGRRRVEAALPRIKLRRGAEDPRLARGKAALAGFAG